MHDRIRTGDWTGFLRLAQRISFALLSNSYRDDPKAWEIEEEGEVHASEILPPSIGRGRSRRPYFEILMVSPGERAALAGTSGSFPPPATGARRIHLRAGHCRQPRRCAFGRHF
ncbi:MAG: hypothetical protein MPW15_11445 [Candidatus Manganitrophus sp.]|nr:hypothetical protein [Candidatus Manganitrophus sp.]